MKSACAIVHFVSSVVCPAVQYFTTVIKKIVSKICIVLFVTLFVRNISHSNTN
jgi:hypothetical protein